MRSGEHVLFDAFQATGPLRAVPLSGGFLEALTAAEAAASRQLARTMALALPALGKAYAEMLRSAQEALASLETVDFDNHYPKDGSA